MPNLALQLQNPKFDIAGDMRAGQAVKAGEQSLVAGEQTNQLNALNLREKTGSANALNDYRTAAKAGDKNALGKLTGYPEIQKQIFDSLKAMKPDQVETATAKANAFGTAAQYVMSFAPGSPERGAAWNKSIDDLLKGGHIDKTQADYWKRTGPSDLLIQQALTVKDAVIAYTKGEQEAKLTPAQLLDVESKANDFAKNYFGTNSALQFLKPEQIKEREAATMQYRDDLIARLLPKPAAKPAASGTATNVLNLGPKPAAGVPAPQPALGAAPAPVAKPGSYNMLDPTPIGQQGGTKPPAEPAPASLKDWKPGKPVPASHAKAVKIVGKTPEEQRAQLEKLPSGTPIILPDGTPTYRK